MLRKVSAVRKNMNRYVYQGTGTACSPEIFNFVNFFKFSCQNMKFLCIILAVNCASAEVIFGMEYPVILHAVQHNLCGTNNFTKNCREVIRLRWNKR